MNWVFFQSPFLLEEKTKYWPRHIIGEYMNDIALFSGISIFLIFYGYFFFFNNVPSITSKKLKFKNTTIQKLTYLFIFLGVIYRLGEIFTPNLTMTLSSTIQILFYSPTIALALYGLYLIRTKSYPKLSLYHIIFFLFIIYELLYRVSTTMFVSSFLLFSGIFFVYVFEKKKLPILYMSIIAFMFLPFYLTRMYYRTHAELVETETAQGASAEKGVAIVGRIFSAEGQDEFDRFQLEVTRKEKGKYDKNRFENISLFSQVMYYHDVKNRPFLYGETFYWLPLVPIPRVVFPAKPKNLLSTDMAISYQLRSDVGTTSINFPMLVEGYINFGFYGMLVMAFLYGIMFKWFAMKIGLGIGDINILIAINIIKQLIHAEGNITLVFGAIIQVLMKYGYRKIESPIRATVLQ